MIDLTYPELARQVVAELAPHELELMEDIIGAWLNGDLEGRGPLLGESLGSGLDPQLTSEIVIPVVVAAMSTVVSGSVTGTWNQVGSQIRRSWSRRRPPEVKIPEPLTTDQLELVRHEVHDAAMKLGIGRRRADALADSVWGALDRHQREDASASSAELDSPIPPRRRLRRRHGPAHGG